jgi:hypothetical protein
MDPPACHRLRLGQEGRAPGGLRLHHRGSPAPLRVPLRRAALPAAPPARTESARGRAGARNGPSSRCSRRRSPRWAAGSAARGAAPGRGAAADERAWPPPGVPRGGAARGETQNNHAGLFRDCFPRRAPVSLVTYHALRTGPRNSAEPTVWREIRRLFLAAGFGPAGRPPWRRSKAIRAVHPRIGFRRFRRFRCAAVLLRSLVPPVDADQSPRCDTKFTIQQLLYSSTVNLDLPIAVRPRVTIDEVLGMQWKAEPVVRT